MAGINGEDWAKELPAAPCGSSVPPDALLAAPKSLQISSVGG